MKREKSRNAAETQPERDFKRQRTEEHSHNHDARSRHTYLGFDILRMFVTSTTSCRQAVARNKSMMFFIVLQSIKESDSREDTTMLRGLLSVFSKICEEREGRNTAIEHGGTRLLLNAMKKYPHDLSIIINASASLCWLVHTKSPKAISSLAAGSEGIGLVLDLMKRYLCNPSIFGNVICILIGILIADPSRQDFHCAETIALCIHGMEHHDASAKVRRNGLTLLRLLTIDSPICQNIVLQHIESIRMAMAQAYGDSDALEEGCGVLANVCMLSRGREKVLETGCVEIVLSSQLCSSSPRLQQFAALFHSLLLSNHGIEESISAFGGGQVIIDTMLARTSQE